MSAIYEVFNYLERGKLRFRIVLEADFWPRESKLAWIRITNKGDKKWLKERQMLNGTER